MFKKEIKHVPKFDRQLRESCVSVKDQDCQYCKTKVSDSSNSIYDWTWTRRQSADTQIIFNIQVQIIYTTML